MSFIVEYFWIVFSLYSYFISRFGLLGFSYQGGDDGANVLLPRQLDNLFVRYVPDESGLMYIMLS